MIMIWTILFSRLILGSRITIFLFFAAVLPNTLHSRSDNSPILFHLHFSLRFFSGTYFGFDSTQMSTGTHSFSINSLMYMDYIWNSSLNM